jgi:hypothetical protein
MTVSNQHPGSFLNNYFAETVCINLARRSDRWVRAQEEFRLHGLSSVHRFDAYDGAAMRLPDGWDYGAGSYGCMRSHTSVVSAAREKGCPSILILEDDVEFHPDLDALFRQYAEQIPPDWDALLFGGMHRVPPEPVSQNIVRLKETSSTYAFAVRHTLYDAFLEINRDTMIAVDENNHILQQSFKFYGFMPHLAWVRRDYSDVMEGETNPWWLRHSIGLLGPEQERTLRDMGVVLFFDSRSFKSRTEAEPDVELLQSVLRLYMAVVEESAICVVERGDQPVLTRADLPERCHYRSCSQAVSPAQCAGSAATVLGNRQYFVCAPYDIYPLRNELRASLLCCPQHDIVSPMHEPLPLDEVDTRKMLRDEVSAVNTGRYPSVPADALTADFCIIAAPLLRHRQESAERSEILTQSLLDRSRVFRSPSRLVRLSRSSRTLGAAGV